MLTAIVLLTLSPFPPAAGVEPEPELQPEPERGSAAVESPLARPHPFALPAVLTPASAQDEPEVADEGWSGSVAAGVTKTGGNSRITTANVAIDVERKDETGRATGKAHYNYGKQDGDLTQRRFGLQAQYDYFLSETTYALATASYETDEEADLDSRFTAGVGYGIELVQEEDTELNVEAGLSYFKEEFDGPTEGDDYLAVRLATNVKHQINEEVAVENSTQLYQGLERSDDIYGKADTKLRANLTEDFFMQIQVVFDYDNTPASGAERLDTQIIAALGWAF